MDYIGALESAECEANYWVSYWLQDGTQSGASIFVPDGIERIGSYIEEKLMEQHGDMYGGIADWGEYE